MAEILIVDDEALQRDILRTILSEEGHEVHEAGSGKEALDIVKRVTPDIILSDLKMPEMSGVELLDKVISLQMDPSPAMIIMTAYGTIDSAVEAIKKGAFDYLTKPLDKDTLLLKLRHAIERDELRRENIYLRDALYEKFRIDGIVGKSEKMIQAIQMLKKVSPTNATVLILGESGTGKELIARALHYNSLRKNKSFTAINCASIPENLLESELFGYEPGAFTGATSRKKGLIELTDGGTLFLDEIGDMPMSLQSKMLRVLQDGEVRRVGGKDSFTADIRTIAATHQDLEMLIRDGQFREDLYYRLKVVTINLPSLLERKEDIADLVESFIRKYNEAFGKRVKGIDQRALRALQDYHWPGNIRQLESIIERAVIMCDYEKLRYEDVRDELSVRKPVSIDTLDIPAEGIDMDELEKSLMKQAMEKSGNVATRAAKLLGLSYKTFCYRWDKYGFSRGAEEMKDDGR